jgi:hypothetical protein
MLPASIWRSTERLRFTWRKLQRKITGTAQTTLTRSSGRLTKQKPRMLNVHTKMLAVDAEARRGVETRFLSDVDVAVHALRAACNVPRHSFVDLQHRSNVEICRQAGALLGRGAQVEKGAWTADKASVLPDIGASPTPLSTPDSLLLPSASSPLPAFLPDQVRTHHLSFPYLHTFTNKILCCFHIS